MKRLLAALLLAAAFAAQAQEAFPSKPVRMLVGFPPGTTADVIARVMAPKMSETLGQPVLVENRPGAGSSIAAEAVAKSAPDGHTLLVSTVANVINPSLYPLAFDFERDLAPVAFLAETPGLVVAHPSAPSDIKALILASITKPESLQYGSSGNGTITHLWGALLNVEAGARLAHVPYKGSSQALTDALEGRIALLFTPASTVVSHVKAGKLRALGAISAQRIPALPDVPTLAEAGIEGFDSGLWFGLNARAGTPQAVIARLNGEAQRILKLPEVHETLTKAAIVPAPGTAEAFGAFIARETKKWARVVKTAGVKAQ